MTTPSPVVPVFTVVRRWKAQKVDVSADPKPVPARHSTSGLTRGVRATYTRPSQISTDILRRALVDGGAGAVRIRVAHQAESR